ncbi:ABC transporter permease, partial [Rhizobium brockwellii]
LVVAAFHILFALLCPGILTIGGFSKFTQNWVPLALDTMAQALLMLNGGITLAIGPLVRHGAVNAATTIEGALGVPGGIL